MSDIAVALLAGGKSSRMGTNKALLELDGRSIIEHVIARVQDALDPAAIMLITNTPDEYAHLGLPMHADIVPDKAALGGIYTALHHSPQPYVLAVACDMPFLNVDLLRHMDEIRAQTAADVIVPHFNDRAQGLHAIYSHACAKPARACMDADRLKVIAFYDQVQVQVVDETTCRTYDPHGLSFFNVNTPDDLAAAQKLLHADDNAPD